MRRLTAPRWRRGRGGRSWTFGRPGSRRLPHARLLRRRSRRRVRPARGWSDLRGAPRAGGGILSTVRATREAGEAGLAAALARHRAGCSSGNDDVRGEVGIRARPRDRARAAARDQRAGGVPTWLGAHAVPPEFADAGADAYLDFLLHDVLPDAVQLAEAADVFLERGAFDAEQARRYLTACRSAGLELRLHGDQFTESGAIPLAIELGARSVDHLESTGRDGSRRWRRAMSSACCCRRARSSSVDRCLRRARSWMRAPRSRWPRTSIRAAPTARVFRSSARSPRRSCGWRQRSRSPRAP